jgi:hypothetical protein
VDCWSVNSVDFSLILKVRVGMGRLLETVLPIIFMAKLCASNIVHTTQPKMLRTISSHLICHINFNSKKISQKLYVHCTVPNQTVYQ